MSPVKTTSGGRRGEKVKEYRYITQREKYYAACEDGSRIGRIRANRQFLIDGIKSVNQIKDGILDALQLRSLSKKINKECDLAFLKKIIFGVYLEEIKLDFLYENYDCIYLSEDDIKKKDPDMYRIEYGEDE
jgi:hypothetical protein